MSRTTCATCVFFAPAERRADGSWRDPNNMSCHSSPVGACRHSPPVGRNDEYGNDFGAGYWPRVDAAHWCGFWVGHDVRQSD